MDVIFEAGRDGNPVTRIMGKIAFPERRGPQPAVGEEWEVIVSGTNPARTVVFLKLVRRISTAAERRAQEERVKAERAQAQAQEEAERLARQQTRRDTAAAARRFAPADVRRAIETGEPLAVVLADGVAAEGEYITGSSVFLNGPVTLIVGETISHYPSGDVLLADNLSEGMAALALTHQAPPEFWGMVWPEAGEELAAVKAQTARYALGESGDLTPWEYRGKAVVATGFTALGVIAVEQAFVGKTPVVVESYSPAGLRAEWEKFAARRAEAERVAAIEKRLSDLVYRLGGFPTPSRGESESREVGMGGHTFGLSALSLYDTGEEWCPESSDGYRAEGYVSVRTAGWAVMTTLTFDGVVVPDVPSEETLEAMEAAFAADSPDGAIYVGETQDEALGRLKYDIEYNSSLLPPLSLPWERGFYIGEAGPFSPAEADSIYYRQVLVDHAGNVVMETGGEISNRHSRSGRYVQATHGWLELGDYDPRCLRVAWVA